MCRLLDAQDPQVWTECTFAAHSSDRPLQSFICGRPWSLPGHTFRQPLRSLLHRLPDEMAWSLRCPHSRSASHSEIHCYRNTTTTRSTQSSSLRLFRNPPKWTNSRNDVSLAVTGGTLHHPESTVPPISPYSQSLCLSAHNVGWQTPQKLCHHRQVRLTLSRIIHSSGRPTRLPALLSHTPKPI